MYVFLEFAAVNDKIKILKLYEHFFLNMKLGRGVINNHNFESSILEFKYDRNASYLIQNVPCIYLK